MSRRNQARRRRNYGRRQHEVRERRTDGSTEPEPWARLDDWAMPDLAEERRGHDDDSYGNFAR